MEPLSDTRAGLADLLERVLDRGVVIRLDLVIGVAGIPLVGLSLHAALASIERMIEYGMFRDWDAATRQAASIEARGAGGTLDPGEKVALEQSAMLQREAGIERRWRAGRVYLTDRRLLFVRTSPYEVLLSVVLPDIAGIGSYGYPDSSSEVTCVAHNGGDVELLRLADPPAFRAVLLDALSCRGIEVLDLDPDEVRKAAPDVIAESQLWWHRDDHEGGWRCGWCSLSHDGSFTFRSDDERDSVDLAADRLLWVSLERRYLGPQFGERDVLCLGRGDDLPELCFIGDDAARWRDLLRRERGRS